MWAKFKTMSNANANANDGEALRCVGESLNVNEEYLSAFRTKSYAEIQTKAQLLVNHKPSLSPLCHGTQNLLEPCQDAIATLLEATNLCKKPKLKTLILNYFLISAEASRICSHLLTSINQFHSNYSHIQRALNINTKKSFSHPQVEYITSQLKSFNLLNNPFSNPNQHDFKHIHDRYAAMLQHLKSNRNEVARKIKLRKCFKRVSGVCITAACSAAATIALLIAAHSVCGLLMGPTIISLPIKINKWWSFGFLSSGALRRTGLQLDVTAKGTYILNRDIDTMSRLVTRFHDEIEHNKSTIQFCLDRKEDKFSLQEVLKELRKSDTGFRKQVEDLEQHVYLSLVTINRARHLVIKEMTTPFAGS